MSTWGVDTQPLRGDEPHVQNTAGLSTEVLRTGVFRTGVFRTEVPRTEVLRTAGLVALILALAGAAVAAVYHMRFGHGIPVGLLTRDVAEVAKLPPYAGLLSQIALLLWPVGVTACFLAASVDEDRTRRAFFVTAGVLTVLLGLDDAFLLHERVLPRMGVPELAVLGVYAALFLYLVVRFRAVILQTRYALLILACLGFGVSALLDMGVQVPYKRMSEEGAKLVGIIGWAVYFFLEARAGFLAKQDVR